MKPLKASGDDFFNEQFLTCSPYAFPEPLLWFHVRVRMQGHKINLEKQSAIMNLTGLHTITLFS